MSLKLLERDTDAPHGGLICITALIYAGLKEAKRAVRGLWLHITDEKHKARSRCGDMRTGRQHVDSKIHMQTQKHAAAPANVTLQRWRKRAMEREEATHAGRVWTSVLYRPRLGDCCLVTHLNSSDALTTQTPTALNPNC